MIIDYDDVIKIVARDYEDHESILNDETLDMYLRCLVEDVRAYVTGGEE